MSNPASTTGLDHKQIRLGDPPISTGSVNRTRTCTVSHESGDPSKAKQSSFCLLTQAGYVAAIQLMWACSITACALI